MKQKIKDQLDNFIMKQPKDCGVIPGSTRPSDKNGFTVDSYAVPRDLVVDFIEQVILKPSNERCNSEVYIDIPDDEIFVPRASNEVREQELKELDNKRGHHGC